MNNKVLKKSFKLQENLASIRKEIGLSKKELATYLDVGEITIDKIEWNDYVHSITLNAVQYISIRHLIDHQLETIGDQNTKKKINQLLDGEDEFDWTNELMGEDNG